MTEQDKTAKKVSAKVGRPSKPMPERIPDSPINVVRAVMHGPPKKNWEYLKAKRSK